MIVDLETLGKEAGAVIATIGAITDDGRTLHARVSIADAVACGLTIDPATLTWWLGRDARHLVVGPPVRLRWAIGDLFRLWSPGEYVWVRGPDFDIPIIEAAASAVGLRVPWPFWVVRDVRTAAMAVGAPIKRKDHNALQDCRDDLDVVRRFEQLCHSVRN